MRTNTSNITNDRIASALCDKRDRDFWREIKRIIHSKTTVSCVIDGKCNSSDTASLFADKYQDLYSLVCPKMREKFRAPVVISMVVCLTVDLVHLHWLPPVILLLSLIHISEPTRPY